MLYGLPEYPSTETIPFETIEYAIPSTVNSEGMELRILPVPSKIFPAKLSAETAGTPDSSKNSMP